MTTLEKPIAVNKEHEKIEQTLTDLSGLPHWDVVRLVRDPIIKGRAVQMVVFPDLGDTEEGVVPTGSVTKFDTRVTPEYLQWVKGADIGCGMLYATFDSVSAKELENDRTRLQKDVDEITRTIINHPTATTGSGNHFFDWVKVGDERKLGVVIHTGSPREQQQKLSDMVRAMKPGQWHDEAYRELYEKVVKEAEQNRLELLAVAEEKYGDGKVQFHKPHNVIVWEDRTNSVTIYKGAVRVTDLTERSLLPSHMQGDMYFYKLGPTAGEESMCGLPHGTGRKIPMRQMGESFKVEPLRIVVPSYDIVRVSKKQYPEAYRSIGEVDKIMQANGLMQPVDFDTVEVLTPIAYTGRLKSRG